MNRNSSTIQELYQNGSNVISGSVTSAGLPTRYLYLSATNNSYSDTGESFSPREMAFASYHDGLTSGQISTFYTLVQTLQTALNRQV